MRHWHASVGSGFTLLELLTAVAVMCILTTLAIPSFTGLIRNNRLASESNLLLSLLTLGRSESVKRMQQVTLCKSSDGNTCSDASSIQWNQGMILFVDANANRILDTSEHIIRSTSPFSPTSEVNFSAGSTLIYRANGSSSSGTFTIESGTAHKQVIVSLAGRARIE